MSRVRRRGFKAALVFIILILLSAAAVNYYPSMLKMSYPLKYGEYVYKYSLEYKLDPYLVFAIIKAESSFDENATSNKNARGLMQLTAVTADWGAKSLKMDSFKVDMLYDPEINIKIGCWYLHRLMKEFDNNAELVTAAYNGGSGNVSQWLKDRNLSTSGERLDKIPFRETENFVKRVGKYRSMYKKLYEK